MSRDIIKLDQIDVTFHQKKRTITAVKDVTIHIQEGDIYGIVGYSGAGKSTLVRVINLLQKPSAGKITIDNDVIFNGRVTLTAEHLRRKRQDIGMIFQHFNLMSQKTAEENVAFALKHSGLSKEEKKAKVAKLLDWLAWRIVLKTTLHNYQEDKNSVWPLRVPWPMTQKS